MGRLAARAWCWGERAPVLPALVVVAASATTAGVAGALVLAGLTDVATSLADCVPAFVYLRSVLVAGLVAVVVGRGVLIRHHRRWRADPATGRPRATPARRLAPRVVLCVLRT
jgi:uncharacterized membrane protein